MRNFWVNFVGFLSVMVITASSNVILMGKNVTLSFDDKEASFAPSVKVSGVNGTLYIAEPLNACSPLTNGIPTGQSSTKPPFVLIVRGGCNFEEKVRRAQAAGFKAAIVYDTESGELVTMAGNSAGIKIYAMFVSRSAGEALRKYAGISGIELWIVPSYQNSAWSVMAISFISLLAMSAVLATCFFVQRHRIRRERHRMSRAREFHGMSSHLVKAMPSLIFTSVLEDNCTSSTCAICLEDYTVGEKLRVLPCHHKFHAVCVDAWLTSWRTFCPVCKRNARTSTGEPRASKSTPLLSSSPASTLSSSIMPSFRSSSTIRIKTMSSRSPSVSHPNSVSSTPYNQQYLRSYNLSPFLAASQSSVNLRSRPKKCFFPKISGFLALEMIHLVTLVHLAGSSTRFVIVSPLQAFPHMLQLSRSQNVKSRFIVKYRERANRNQQSFNIVNTLCIVVTP